MEQVRRNKQIGGYKDQAGNLVRRERMFKLVLESMLVNVIALEKAGVPLKELAQALGCGGGTIIGRGVVLRTPIEERLSEDDARELIECYSKLTSEYSKGKLDRSLLDNVKLRNNVPSKVSIIRTGVERQNR